MSVDRSAQNLRAEAGQHRIKICCEIAIQLLTGNEVDLQAL